MIMNVYMHIDIGWIKYVQFQTGLPRKKCWKGEGWTPVSQQETCRGRAKPCHSHPNPQLGARSTSHSSTAQLSTGTHEHCDHSAAPMEFLAYEAKTVVW